MNRLRTAQIVAIALASDTGNSGESGESATAWHEDIETLPSARAEAR